MIEALVGLIIFILGFGFGILVFFITYKYFSILKLESTSDLKISNGNEMPKDEFKNITSDLITEWQTGKAIGVDDDE